MAKAVIVTLADDVVDQLNAKQGGWAVAFKAERKYQPKVDLEVLDTIKCLVAAAAWRVSPDNRTDWAHEFDIDIGIMFRAGPKSGDQATAKFDDLLKLVEEIVDYWQDTRPTIGDCPLTEIKLGPQGNGNPYVAEDIEPNNQFTSIIRLTFWKLR